MMDPLASLIDLVAGRPVQVHGDPTVLVQAALEHRVGGLLWTKADAGEVTLPEGERDRLMRSDMAAWGRHLRLYESLERLKERLDGLGIQFYVFKGLAFEQAYYSRIGERPCYDLDLVVDPGQVGRLGEVVAALQPDHPLAASVQRLVDVGALQSVDVRLVDGAPLDLHVDPIKLGFPLRTAQRMWETCGWVRTPAGIEVRSPSPEAALVQALVHINRNRFRFLLHHADVVRIARHPHLDWDEADRLARLEGLDVVVRNALAAVEADLGVTLGPWCSPRGWRSLLWRGLWRPSIRLQGEIAGLKYQKRSQFAIPALVRGRGTEIIKVIARRAVPPREVVDYLHGATPGPYPIKLALGRLRRIADRLSRARDLRRRDPSRP